MSSRLMGWTRLVALLCAISLAGVLVFPIWRIELSAPQYPEGLVLKIYANKLGGGVDVVNGLNHYIGMRTLHEKDFVEFQVLPYIIGCLIFFGILTVIINKRWFFFVWSGFFILFAITAIIDFYRWEYNYGHNLDPTAPIQVPGMTYQPPLIGYKQLLNFGAYSIPDAGGWIFIAVGLMLFAFSIIEIRQIRKMHLPNKTTKAVLAASLFFLNSCSTEPRPIKMGVDACDFCKMTISDARFGGEVTTKKGKSYVFDDMHCISGFLKSKYLDQKEIAEIYLVDFAKQGQFVKAGESLLLTSEALNSPMNGNVAAFSSADSLKKFNLQFKGTETNWNAVIR